MASIEKKFDAAVTLIKSLPKDGPFQPSYGMMKKFYGLYKQATIGPCNEPKPAFWEAVKRTKWEAWSALGAMSKDDAMKTYVDEMLKVMTANAKAKDLPHLMQIVETMPHTDDVGNFRQIMGPFFEAMQDKGKLVNGDTPHGHENGEDGLSEDSGRGEDDTELIAMRAISNKVVTVDMSSIANKAGDIGPSGDISNNESHPILVNPSDLPHDDKHSDGTHDNSNSTHDSGRPNDGHDSSISGDDRDHDDDDTHRDDMLEREEEEGGNKSESEESESGSEVFQDSMDQPVVEKLPPLMTPAQQRLGNGPILTSTPHRQIVVTQAEVHDTHNATQPLNSSVVGSRQSTTTSRRGGGEVTPGERGQGGRGQMRDQAGRDDTAGRRRGSGRGSSEPDSRRTGSSGGASGGRGGPGRNDNTSFSGDVSEQISTALERLQRDMNSVLIRLNSLEALALSRQQNEIDSEFQRGPPGVNSVSPSSRRRGTPWWLFRPLPRASVFFLLVWPLIVHWTLKFLAKRRRLHRRF